MRRELLGVDGKGNLRMPVDDTPERGIENRTACGRHARGAQVFRSLYFERETEPVRSEPRPRSVKPGGAELGPPLCSDGTPGLGEERTCALRALIISGAARRIHDLPCYLARPCFALVDEMPRTWIADPLGHRAHWSQQITEPSIDEVSRDVTQ